MILEKMVSLACFRYRIQVNCDPRRVQRLKLSFYLDSREPNCILKSYLNGLCIETSTSLAAMHKLEGAGEEFCEVQGSRLQLISSPEGPRTLYLHTYCTCNLNNAHYGSHNSPLRQAWSQVPFCRQVVFRRKQCDKCAPM